MEVKLIMKDNKEAKRVRVRFIEKQKDHNIRNTGHNMIIMIR